MTARNDLKKAVADFLKRKEDQLHPLGGGYQNILFTMDDDQAIVRISEIERRAPEQVQAEIDWLRYMTANGCPLPQPVPMQNGKDMGFLHLEDQTFVVALFTKQRGGALDPANPIQWNTKMFREWGAILGKMHDIAKHYTVQARVTRYSWNVQAACLQERLGRIDTALLPSYIRLIQEINSFKTDRDNYGLIHNDFHHGNLLWDNGSLNVVDTDDCCYSWFASDIAVALYHANWQGKSVHTKWLSLHRDFMEHFLSGYQEQNCLPENLVKQIDCFLRYREFFLYELFHRVWDLGRLEPWQSFTLDKIRQRIGEETVPINLL